MGWSDAYGVLIISDLARFGLMALFPVHHFNLAGVRRGLCRKQVGNWLALQ